MSDQSASELGKATDGGYSGQGVDPPSHERAQVRTQQSHCQAAPGCASTRLSDFPPPRFAWQWRTRERKCRTSGAV